MHIYIYSHTYIYIYMYSQWASRCHRGKESACQHRRHKRLGFNPWIRKISWSRKWKPTPVFLLENSKDRGVWHASVLGVAKSQT